MGRAGARLVWVVAILQGTPAAADPGRSARVDDQTPIASCRGIPLLAPLGGDPREVSSGYRAARPNGRRHRGIDLRSERGEPVHAVAAGTVVFAGIGHPRGGVSNLSPARAGRVSRRAMGIGGLFVLIDHGRGLTSGYFHLADYAVSRGDQVAAGQPIGSVGDTGMKESQPHLHFELRVRGQKINPARWLAPYLLRPAAPRRRCPEA